MPAAGMCLIYDKKKAAVSLSRALDDSLAPKEIECSKTVVKSSTKGIQNTRGLSVCVISLAKKSCVFLSRLSDDSFSPSFTKPFKIPTDCLCVCVVSVAKNLRCLNLER